MIKLSELLDEVESEYSTNISTKTQVDKDSTVNYSDYDVKVGVASFTRNDLEHVTLDPIIKLNEAPEREFLRPFGGVGSKTDPTSKEYNPTIQNNKNLNFKSGKGGRGSISSYRDQFYKENYQGIADAINKQIELLFKNGKFTSGEFVDLKFSVIEGFVTSNLYKNKKRAAISEGAIQMFIEKDTIIFQSKNGIMYKQPSSKKKDQYLRYEHSIPGKQYKRILYYWWLQNKEKGLDGLTADDIKTLEEKYFALTIISNEEDKKLGKKYQSEMANIKFDQNFNYRNPPADMWIDRYNQVGIKILYPIDEIVDTINVKFDLENGKPVNIQRISNKIGPNLVLTKKQNKSEKINKLITPTTRKPFKRQNSEEYKQKIRDFLDTKNYEGKSATDKWKNAMPDVENEFGDYPEYLSDRLFNNVVYRYFVDKNNSQNEEISRLQELAGIKENDNEWDLEAGPEWNEIELTVGDIITPDMWDKEKMLRHMNYHSSDTFSNIRWRKNLMKLFDEPHEIKKIHPSSDEPGIYQIYFEPDLEGNNIDVRSTSLKPYIKIYGNSSFS